MSVTLVFLQTSLIRVKLLLTQQHILNKLQNSVYLINECRKCMHFCYGLMLFKTIKILSTFSNCGSHIFGIYFLLKLYNLKMSNKEG